jgi:hypothetical protein
MFPRRNKINQTETKKEEVWRSYGDEYVDVDHLGSALKMEKVCTSETLVSAYKFTRRYNPERAQLASIVNFRILSG